MKAFYWRDGLQSFRYQVFRFLSYQMIFSSFSIIAGVFQSVFLVFCLHFFSSSAFLLNLQLFLSLSGFVSN